MVENRLLPDPNERRYQVFVSSTFSDLQTERQKVLQAILEMKAFPAGMELFPSADEEQFAFIKREIDSSDYYIIIIAGRYGSTDASGTSYTEREYDYAVSSGKTILRFLHHDISSIKVSLSESDPQLKAKLEAFRIRVRNGRLCQMYSNPDDLKSKVWQSLSSEMQLKPGEGWVRAKNARRIEDLSKITDLQSQVIDLQDQLRALKDANRDRGLPKGDDSCEFAIYFSDKILPSDSDTVKPFPFRATWDELLYATFHEAYPEPDRTTVLEGLINLVLEKYQASYPERESLTLDKSKVHSMTLPEDQYMFDNLEDLITKCQVIFSGKGLVKIERRKNSMMFLGDSFGVDEHWVLTSRGLTAYAAIEHRLSSTSS